MFPVMFFFSCSVEKNTGATRNFHNLTSHYNIYFNATESYKQGLNRAGESFTDDFTDVLPLFYYEEEAVQQSIKPQMKRSIDKATKVITFHSIKAKPKVRKGKQSEKDKLFYDKNEYNKWVDDCYVLIGRSYMQQGDFFLAAESFKHAIKNYPEEESYFLALTWLSRAYAAMGELNEAEEVTVLLKDAEDFPKKYREDLYLSLADYHLRSKEYKPAAEFLEKALDTRPSKNNRIRYTYILAQIYKEDGQGDKSIANFKKVVRMNPPYVMAFNAKVSMAEAFEAGSSNSSEIRKLLNKMLKDSKNKEYQDQIYFALGNLAMEEGDRQSAIDYYHKSVRASVQNNYQKGESCLTLAEIYYKEPVYTLSAAYYDTAVNLLSEDYPNFSTLKLRSRSLNGLVSNINTFELQDSVQRLAAMDEAERFAVIDEIIAKIRKEEEEARLRQQQEMQDLQFNREAMYTNQSGMGNNQQTGGKWYFYNLNAKSFGQPEFRMKWGQRKLEDNWRRSNKQTSAIISDENGLAGVETSDSSGVQVIDNKSREYYLRDIPLTDSAMSISHIKLEEALYNMGMIYRDELLDYTRAVESLEELVKRYPEGDFTMPAYYYLHELYNTVQQPAKAQNYKELLSQKYPESHMAKLLTNPNYIRELDAAQARIEQFYVSVYEDYANNRYPEVIDRAEEGIKLYSQDKDLASRLAYLKAMSAGAVKGKETMKAELDSILANYPGTPVAAEAKEIIDYMYVAFPVIKEADQVKEATQIYNLDLEANHYFLLALKRNQNLNLVNFNLLNFNLDNFNSYDLEIVLQRLETDYNLLVVKGFNDIEGVRRYAEKVETSIQDIMGEISPEAYELVLISDKNLATLIREKKVVPYLLFYRQNYMQNVEGDQDTVDR